MNGFSDQQRARAFGVLYLITFVTSILALWLYQPVLDDPVKYIAGSGQNNRIVFGVLLELLLIIANIGTAVVIFPIVKRQNEELALGYVPRACSSARSSSSASSPSSGSSPCRRKRQVQWRARSPIRSPRSRTGRSSSGRAGSSVGGTG
jgi:hypothetical protein